MDKKTLTEIVGREVAKLGFKRIRNGWSYALPCADPILITIGMVKARWGNEYQFWTIVLVDGAFGEDISKVQSFPIGDGTVFRVEQTDYRRLFQLDETTISDDAREQEIVKFINNSLASFVEIAKNPNGVQRLGISGLVMITPPLVGELKRLGLWDDSLDV